jgi:RHS repeat-associated protein
MNAATLNQNRAHNKANEITSITRTTGTNWPTPEHDLAGNMTKVPRPLSLGNSFNLKWDAWNRLVEVKNTGGSVVATHAYDSLHRRITKTTGATVRRYYYSDEWQVLEERLGAASTAERRFVWGMRGIDDLVLRDRETGGGSSSSSEEQTERLYALHDGLSLTALIDTSGNVQERYGYEGFGSPRYMTAAFGNRTSSLYQWETLFHRHRYDLESGLYQVRYRSLHPSLGIWLSRDPIGEEGVPNLYGFTANNPVNRTDLLGLLTLREPLNWEADIDLWFMSVKWKVSGERVWRITEKVPESDCPDTRPSLSALRPTTNLSWFGSSYVVDVAVGLTGEGWELMFGWKLDVAAEGGNYMEQVWNGNFRRTSYQRTNTKAQFWREQVRLGDQNLICPCISTSITLTQSFEIELRPFRIGLALATVLTAHAQRQAAWEAIRRLLAWLRQIARPERIPDLLPA